MMSLVGHGPGEITLALGEVWPGRFRRKASALTVALWDESTVLPYTRGAEREPALWPSCSRLANLARGTGDITFIITLSAAD